MLCPVDRDLARYERELDERLKEQEKQEPVWGALDAVLEERRLIA